MLQPNGKRLCSLETQVHSLKSQLREENLSLKRELRDVKAQLAFVVQENAKYKEDVKKLRSEVQDATFKYQNVLISLGENQNQIAAIFTKLSKL